MKISKKTRQLTAVILGISVALAATMTSAKPHKQKHIDPNKRVSISTSQSSYRSTDEIIINFGKLPATPNNFIAVYHAGEKDAIREFYSNGKATGTFDIADLAPGDYSARLFLNGSNKLAYEISFSVEDESSVEGTLAQTRSLLSQNRASSGSLTVLAFGDPGTGDSRQFDTAETMKDRCESVGCDIGIMLGDNFYEDGLSSVNSSQWERKFEEPYGPLGIDIFPTLGNHDARGSLSAQVKYTALSDIWKLPAKFHDFVKGPVHFFVLNTNDFGSNQKNWLENQLRKSTSRWKVVYGHHTLRSNGSHGDNSSLVKNLEPLLCDLADMYISGHDHDMQFLRARCGLDIVVSGAAAKTRSTNGGSNSFFDKGNTNGFAIIEFDQEKITTSFFNKANDRLFTKSSNGNDNGGNDGGDNGGDDDGNTQGPKVSFASPSSGTTSSNNLSVVINASDSDGIKQVELFINDQYVRRERREPYEWGKINGRNRDSVLLNLSPGSYTLKAIATDKSGDKTTATRPITISGGDDNNNGDSLGGDVCFFDHSRFRGDEDCFNEGNQINHLGRLANTFSSVKIKAGFEVMVCDHKNLVDCVVIKQSMDNLSDIRFSNGDRARNDITSFRVL